MITNLGRSTLGVLIACVLCLVYFALLRQPVSSFVESVESVAAVPLFGTSGSQHLVDLDSNVTISSYGDFPFPIYLKVSDTYGWLTTNEGELKIQQVLRNIFSSPVSRSEGVLINVGAHECFFCVLAAVHNYRVYAFEPLPQCIRDIQDTFSIYPQEVCNRVALYNRYVSDGPFKLATPIKECYGKFSQQEVPKSPAEVTYVSSISLDSMPSPLAISM